ncbi:universal stress protein [Pseudolysinimonas sp.]|uniref:universal stress protein n=1 Tax=Pseudolysinimonas sp. TaxID=2680009 RepID=UPI00286B2E09|nr:universal stress protein [Pseudolysinimonas sp.]
MRYIVGIDGSAPSDAALVWATTRARRDAAPLVIAHVVDAEAGRMGPDFRAEATDLGRRLLAATKARLSTEEPKLEVQSALLDGSAPWELTRFASPDDVLVVGTHKTGFSSGRVLGSLSVQIAAASSCTVAVIPGTDVRFRHGVVAGIDREQTARHIAELAAREAVTRGDELTLLHAGPAGEGGVIDARPLQTALAHVRASYPDLIVQARRSTRAPSAALLDAAHTKALLVIGPGSTGVDRSPIGTVVHEVLLNANAPVLVAGLPALTPAS